MRFLNEGQQLGYGNRIMFCSHLNTSTKIEKEEKVIRYMINDVIKKIQKVMNRK